MIYEAMAREAQSKGELPIKCVFVAEFWRLMIESGQALDRAEASRVSFFHRRRAAKLFKRAGRVLRMLETA